MHRSHPYQRPGNTGKAGKSPKIKSETNLSCEGHESTRNDSNKQSVLYRTLLQTGIIEKGTGRVLVAGILSKTDKENNELIEYDHQRQFVKKAAHGNREFILCAHEAGLGKTASFLQLMAMLEVLKINKDGSRGGCRAIVVAPPSCLNQWEDTAHTWLNIPNKKICIVQTTRRRMIDVELLRRVRVLIISRHLLEKLFTECWEFKAKYEKNARGSWVGKWVRKDGVPLHPFWRERWDLLGIDEVCYRFLELTSNFACI